MFLVEPKGLAQSEPAETKPAALALAICAVAVVAIGIGSSPLLRLLGLIL
jgi:hypothetical protein